MKRLSEAILGTVLAASACATPQRLCPEVPQSAQSTPPTQEDTAMREVECFRRAYGVIRAAYTALSISESITPGMEERDCRIAEGRLVTAQLLQRDMGIHLICVGQDIRATYNGIVQSAQNHFERACSQVLERNPSSPVSTPNSGPR